MTKWEYEEVTGTSQEMLQDLNSWGEKGWEIVDIKFGKGTGYYACIMKRPLER